MKNFKIVLLLTAMLFVGAGKSFSDDYWTNVNVTEAGTFSEIISDLDKASIRALKITGQINGDDLFFIATTWAGGGEDRDENCSIIDLDLSDCKIVEGGYRETEEDVLPKKLFWSELSFENINLPRSLKRIEENAVGYRNQERSIYIHNSIEYIHPSNPIKQMVIEEGGLYTKEPYGPDDSGPWILRKGDALIAYDTYSSTVKIPNDITSIESLCFIDNYSFIENLDLPEGLKSIGDDAIDCSHLKELNLPSSLVSVGERFVSSSELESITFPKSIEKVGSECIGYCPKLTTIAVESGNPYYDSRNNCNAIIETATNKLISGCKTTIIPSDIESIGIKAFSDKDIESITIPSSVHSIGEEAFFGSNNITIKLESKKPIWLDDRIFYGWATTLLVPRGSKSAYESAANWKDAKTIIEYADPRFDVTLGAEYGTFCSTADLDFTDVERLKAYAVTGYSPSSGKVTLTRVTKVPAGTGVVLKGTAGTDYTIPEANETDILSNLLVGTTEDVELSSTEGTKTNFILANDDEKGIGFYAVSSTGSLKAGKAYLQLPTSALPAAARSLTIEFDDQTADVESITTAVTTDGHMHDLRGQRVSAPTKGIYIRNGKKIVK